MALSVPSSGASECSRREDDSGHDTILMSGKAWCWCVATSTIFAAACCFFLILYKKSATATAGGLDCGNTTLGLECRCGNHCGPSQKTAQDQIYTFYYPWYASKAVDRQWSHWNERTGVGGGTHDPNSNDLASPYYPLLGPYSSSDRRVIYQHMSWMREAGIGVVVTSWWGKHSFEDRRVGDILDAADDYGLKVAFYIEPYDGGYRTGGTRTPCTAMADVKYLIELFGCHRAVHRINGRPVFLFFAARNYKNGEQDEWKTVWDTLHGDERYNPIVITQDSNLNDRIIAGGWDGGHKYGCDGTIIPNWKELAAQYESAGKLFFFTTCPGYDKSRLSPGTDPVISRENGQLYEYMWTQAISSRTKTTQVVICSFNEWHEGTSIEPAIPMSIASFSYGDYEGHWNTTGSAASKVYLVKTKEFSDKFLEAWS